MITDYYMETVTFVAATTSTGWGVEPGWATSSSTFAAAVNPKAGQVIFAGQKETAFSDYKLYCSDTVALAVHNRVHWGGDTFDVLFVKDTLDMGHHKAVWLKKVTL